MVFASSLLQSRSLRRRTALFSPGVPLLDTLGGALVRHVAGMIFMVAGNRHLPHLPLLLAHLPPVGLVGKRPRLVVPT